MKLDFWNKNTPADEAPRKAPTRGDITPELYRELEDEFYAKFDFMKLYLPPSEGGFFAQYGTYIIVGAQILTLLTVWWKK